MAVTIRDLLELQVMKDFKVIAGEAGLNETIKGTEILDFEFVVESKGFRDKIFEGDSLVLCSFLFAKDKPEMIVQAVKRLIGLQVKALAYKPVFFKQLPQEALDYANRMKFPILEFGHDEFFEHIIYSVGELLEKDGNLLRAEPLIKEMISKEFSAEESAAALDKINPFLRPKVMACCIRSKDETEEGIMANIRRTVFSDKLQNKIFFGKYQDLYIIILSQEEENRQRFEVLLEDVVICCSLSGKELIMGYSSILDLKDGLGKAVREAYWAEKIAEIEEVMVKSYHDAGIYKLVVAHINAKGTSEYMEEYLAPLFTEEEKDGELLRTAVEYIQAKGDAAKTAERLFCHKNTIRYRIGKLQEKLDPGSEEKEFYLNLATAIKIYLLINH